VDVDVVVVGAGLAGLTAARDLQRAGLSVQVLEARDRVGGRTLNADLGDGRVVEVGGQWVGPQQTAVLALADELGVARFPTHDEGRNLLEWQGRVRRYRGTVPRLNPLVLVDVAQAQARLERMAGTVPLEAPWLAPDARGWDSTTLESWLRRHVRTAPARELLRLGVEAVWAADPGELSLLHALFYLRSAAAGRRCSTPAAAPSRTASSAARSGCPCCWRRRWTSCSARRSAGSRRTRQGSPSRPRGGSCGRGTWSWRCRPRWPGASSTTLRCRRRGSSSRSACRWARW
jgi:monoamine oxidase